MSTLFKTPRLRVPLESIRQVIPAALRRTSLILRDVIRRPYRPRFDLDLDLKLDFGFAPEVEVTTSRCSSPDEGELEPDVRRTNQLPTNVQSV